MESLVNKLLVKMQTAFRENAAEQNLVRRYGENVKTIKEIIRELRDYHIAHPFRKKADEIHYFKTQAPPFYSQYFYHNLLLSWELFRKTSDKERQLAFLERELARVNHFFELNADFVRYYYLDRSDLDDQLFTCQDKPGEGWVRDEFDLVLDGRFCLGSFALARTLAHEQYGRFLRMEIDSMQNPENLRLGEFLEKTFEFADTNAAAVEWIMSFSRRKLIKINGVDADAKTLGKLFESVFERKLGNVYDTQNTNVNRKRDPTPFLNSLIRAVTRNDFDK